MSSLKADTMPLKRSEQKEARREDILLCAMDLFIKKGYVGTKISDIASAAGMSQGLLFHYFDSKEDLYFELVKTGVEGAQYPLDPANLSPLEYFEKLLSGLFAYNKEQPWFFKMFVLVNRAQQDGAPERVRKLANSLNQIELSAQIIEKGQALGEIRDGNPYALSACFWASVQGVLEQIAIGAVQFDANPDWLISIIRKQDE